MEASQRDLGVGRYTDVVLVPGDGGPTTLHSLLLSAASPFLCTLLSSMRLNDGWMKPIEFSNKETTQEGKEEREISYYQKGDRGDTPL